MYVHYYKRREPIVKVWRRHIRRNWWVYPGKKGDDKNSILEFHIETLLQRLNLEFAWRFHIGNAGSETPWDGHIKLFGQAFYWGFSRGRRLADWITSRKGGYHARDITFRINDGHFYWTLWIDEMNGHKRSWRYGSLALNPMTWFFGRKFYSYEDMDRYVGKVDFEEDEYPVIFTVQKIWLGRQRSKRRVLQGWCIDVDAPKGVPTHDDKSGGWKGDRSYGWSVDWPYSGVHSEWYIDAKRLVEAWVLKERGRTGFRERQVD